MTSEIARDAIAANYRVVGANSEASDGAADEAAAQNNQLRGLDWQRRLFSTTSATGLRRTTDGARLCLGSNEGPSHLLIGSARYVAWWQRMTEPRARR